MFNFDKSVFNKNLESYVLSKKSNPSYLFITDEPANKDSLLDTIDLIIRYHSDQNDKVYLVEDNNRISSVENDIDSHNYTFTNTKSLEDFFKECIEPYNHPLSDNMNKDELYTRHPEWTSKIIFITTNTLTSLPTDSQDKLGVVLAQMRMRGIGVICYDFENNDNLNKISHFILANRKSFDLDDMYIQREGEILLTKRL